MRDFDGAVPHFAHLSVCAVIYSSDFSLHFGCLDLEFTRSRTFRNCIGGYVSVSPVLENDDQLQSVNSRIKSNHKPEIVGREEGGATNRGSERDAATI